MTPYLLNTTLGRGNGQELAVRPYGTASFNQALGKRSLAPTPSDCSWKAMTPRARRVPRASGLPTKPASVPRKIATLTPSEQPAAN